MARLRLLKSITLQAQVVVDPSCCQFDAPGNDNHNKEQEWVCLRNTGEFPVEMTGWHLRDEHGWEFAFPAFVLSPRSTVRVVTGSGENTSDVLYWCYSKSTAVWNNTGDTVFLFDDERNLVDEYHYP